MVAIKKKVGRPKTGNAMTNAEKQAAYRKRKMKKEAEQDAGLLKSSTIDLSAVKIWKRTAK